MDPHHFIGVHASHALPKSAMLCGKAEQSGVMAARLFEDLRKIR
jgi:hypothetical protein